MAKAKKQVSFEDALWGACDKLRGTVEPAEYKHVVLSLIFLRGIPCDLGEKAANTFTNNLHKDLRADYIMANPPFI